MDDFGSIIETLKSFFAGFLGRKERRNQRQESAQLPVFKGFQAPLKDWENSGNFSPGVATDPRHPRGHDGLDMRTSLGSALYPICPGTVQKAYTDPKGGLAIVIQHANNVSSYYAHCNSINVKPGDIVDYDTIIGTVGYSGNAHPSRGGGIPHCHLQIWQNGALTNPNKFFPVKAYKPFDPKKEQIALPGVKPIPEPQKLV